MQLPAPQAGSMFLLSLIQTKKPSPAQVTPVERFEPVLRCGLPDFVTVCSKEDVRFTFKDGTKIRV